MRQYEVLFYPIGGRVCKETVDETAIEELESAIRSGRTIWTFKREGNTCALNLAAISLIEYRGVEERQGQPSLLA